MDFSGNTVRSNQKPAPNARAKTKERAMIPPLKVTSVSVNLDMREKTVKLIGTTVRKILVKIADHALTC